jgi:hypothetical protein
MIAALTDTKADPFRAGLDGSGRTVRATSGSRFPRWRNRFSSVMLRIAIPELQGADRRKA